MNTNLYYNALYDDPRIAKNMVNGVHDNLSKFERYLSLAIKALREKSHVTAEWDKVDDPSILSFEPLVYEVAVSTSSAIEVFIEEKYLEINVTNSILFDPSEGIRLDQNWSPLFPKHFEFKSISNTRHLLKLNDWSLYNGEKTAVTRDGSIAEIKPFEIDHLMQNNEEIRIVDKQYNPLKGSYSFVIEGNITEEADLLLNGFFIDQSSWYILNSKEQDYFNEKNQKIPVKKREGNRLFIERTIEPPREIYSGGLKVDFRLHSLAIPQTIANGAEEIKVESDKGKYFTLGNTGFIGEGFQYLHPVHHFPLFKITVEKNQNLKNRAGYTAIRLRDEEEDDDFFAKSKIDYFFDQDTEELEGIAGGKEVKLKIDRRNADERVLYVKSVDGRRLDYKSIPDVLSIRVNTYQLEMQRKALQRLKNTPLLEHKPLIKLSQKKSMSHLWENFIPQDLPDWKVLTDSTREGAIAQREFVLKALGTPDFALLEGPPGSGKTTTILELILQLIKQGKRILLCGSTHVAIDNVLERLKEKDLMDGIFPLRIGSRESVNENIREYCLEEYDNHKYGELMVEAANLVCGTTIGILRHPLFKLKGDEVPVPKYDYLIIDESSKTTFQEFLIPALYAERWVLVGDIKQLPPFNDREQIIAGIDDNEKLKPALKEASLLIYQYMNQFKVRMPVCIVRPEEVIKEVQKELAATMPEDFKKRVAVVDKSSAVESLSFVPISEKDIDGPNPVIWALNGVEVVFVNEKVFDKVEKLIPANMVVLKEGWEHTGQHYQVDAYYSQHPKELHRNLEYTWKFDRKRDKLPLDFLLEQQQFLKEKTWATEYGWRMVRVFELENVEGSRTKENYRKQLQQLAPKTASERSLKDIEHVGDIALPSILQALQEGVGKNREHSLDTTLNSGFNALEKKARFVTLDYQHRMHPDISKFPRKQFYQNTALQNSTYTKTKREWSYDRYPGRNIWLDVDGRMKRSSNEAEVRAMMKELKYFIEWARENENPETGKWEIACLTFYNAQRKLLAEELQKLTGQKTRIANFTIDNIEIKNYTVDKFQGQEADITFLSMVRTERGMGFMDNPNRLNVGITRARFQRVIVGKYHYFLNNSQSEQLRILPRESVYFKNK
ncbi:AAA domain-containing protein [Mesobacillus harenae]|uniref:AAA domain-containing protein n=1 Tax=Mesobacillus harenae TaxID=2213203 RepID=UPI00157FD34C|nr:AAA domain-containing protein [Mesobacillus harenae]